MSEIWKPVVGHPGYEVSNVGRVRSLLTCCILRPALNRGYPAVCLRGKTRKVHALVAEAFIGPRPEGQEVRHYNGDKRDARKRNLRYGTRAQNRADARRHGTAPRGSMFISAKLTDSVVKQLRAMAHRPPYRVLARQYQCSWQTIQKAIRGQTWTHV